MPVRGTPSGSMTISIPCRGRRWRPPSSAGRCRQPSRVTPGASGSGRCLAVMAIATRASTPRSRRPSMSPVTDASMPGSVPDGTSMSGGPMAMAFRRSPSGCECFGRPSRLSTGCGPRNARYFRASITRSMARSTSQRARCQAGRFRSGSAGAAKGHAQARRPVRRRLQRWPRSRDLPAQARSAQEPL